MKKIFKLTAENGAFTLQPQSNRAQRYQSSVRHGAGEHDWDKCKAPTWSRTCRCFRQVNVPEPPDLPRAFSRGQTGTTTELTLL